MKEGGYPFKLIPKDYQTVLERLYGRQTEEDAGYSSVRIQYVQLPSEDEQQFFGQRYAAPNFFQQTLYKVKGKLLPPRFNFAIRQMAKETEALRCNYVKIGERVLRVVFAERRKLKMPVYRNFEQMDGQEQSSAFKAIMEADMREPFDLIHGSLVRFAAFHTGKEEYAVLVTAARPVVEQFDMAALFRAAMDEDAKYEATINSESEQRTKIATNIRDYWSGILAKFPPLPKLPFVRSDINPDYAPLSFRAVLPPDVISDIRREAKSNDLLFITYLATAWGLLLQQVNEKQDIGICLLMPQNSPTKHAGANPFYLIPVHLAAFADLTVRQMINAAFQQLIISRSYAGFDWTSLPEIDRRDSAVFDHFLSFYDFLAEHIDYAEAAATLDGTVVNRSAWDAQGMKLGVYFHDEGDTVSISFLYDGHQFESQGIEFLAERYAFILQRMIKDTDSSVNDFLRLVSGRVAKENSTATERADQARAKLYHFVSRLKYLQGASAGTLQKFRKICRRSQYFGGDRISRQVMDSQVIFIMEGELARRMDAGDGWYDSLDTVGEGMWLNETVLLPDRAAKMTAEVVSETATLVTVPLDAMRSCLREEPEVKNQMFFHVLSEMEKYRCLWIKSKKNDNNEAEKGESRQGKSNRGD